MNHLMKSFAIILFIAPTLLVLTEKAVAQDPTVVDSAHYKVALENDDVRVLRITYGPGESSVMHFHPRSVVVSLTDANVTFKLPDGSMREMSMMDGQVLETPAGMHQPKNNTDMPMEVIQIEFKSDDDAMEDTMKEE